LGQADRRRIVSGDRLRAAGNHFLLDVLAGTAVGMGAVRTSRLLER
jgi:hypothetical protein